MSNITTSAELAWHEDEVSCRAAARVAIDRPCSWTGQVLQRGIPFMVILGEKEVQQGVVQLKDMTRHTQEVGLLACRGCSCTSIYAEPWWHGR